jgi:Fic family protein
VIISAKITILCEALETRTRAMTNIEAAIALKKELDGLRPLTSEQESKIWQKFRFEWNYHSNNIEGNSLTFGETKSLLLHNITAQGKPLKDHVEITGHNEAISALLDVVRGGDALTESFVRNLHTLILRERYQVDAQTPDGLPTKKWIEVGQYKTSPNHVLTVTGEIFRFAEPIEVPSKMQQLVAGVNTTLGKTDVEALIAAAKAHYDLVLIHPFDDGNGRMARLLMNLILVKHGFPPAIIETQDKENYFAALRQADGGQFEVFVDYVAKCVRASLEVMLAGARGEDLDKFDIRIRQKILAMERLLTANGKHVFATRSPETVSFAVENVLIPLRSKLIETLAKFSNLVITAKVEFWQRTAIGFVGTNHFEYAPLASREEIQSATESGKLVLKVVLLGVRSVGFSAYQKSWDIEVELRDDHLQLRCTDLDFVLDVRYKSELSSEQMRTVDQALTNGSMTWLQDVTSIDIERTLSGK